MTEKGPKREFASLAADVGAALATIGRSWAAACDALRTTGDWYAVQHYLDVAREANRRIYGIQHEALLLFLRHATETDSVASSDEG